MPLCYYPPRMEGTSKMQEQFLIAGYALRRTSNIKRPLKRKKGEHLHAHPARGYTAFAP